MSLFGSIISKIFGSAAPATPVTLLGGSTAPGAATAAAGAAPTAAASNVDVSKVLDDLTEASDEDDIDWRKSIVDLLKLLKLDSSLAARKGLAKELGYTGDTGDSAKMNVWLHKQVMTMLAANGGKVPDSLKH